MLSQDGTLELETFEVFQPLLEPARYKAARGGRGSGKSVFAADYLIERSFLQSGRNILCIREHQRSLSRSSKPLIENRIVQLGVKPYFEFQNEVIRIPGGASMYFEGAKNHTVDSIKSYENVGTCSIEEGQALSKRSWNILTPTIRAPESEILTVWNPNSPKDAVDDFHREAIKAGRKDVLMVDANYWDNPYFPDDLRADMEYDKRRDPEMYAHIWCGEYLKKTAASVFVHGRHWRVGTYEEFEGLKFDRFYQGGDFGFGADPNVLIRVAIQGRKLYILVEVHDYKTEIDHLPFLFCGPHEDIIRKNQEAWDGLSFEQKQRFTGIPDAHRWPTTADSARPETISYLGRHGMPLVSGAKKGAGSIEEGIKFLHKYEIIVHPDCINTIDELTFYSYRIDPKTEEVLPILEDKKNHVIDSIRYSIEKLRRARIGLH